ncbi:hypothetical protein EJ04DRAFT_481535 [Polyplosphaeria fusca]|uniref:N-acetyltransferase domain-containing protein n=1 Tax=Polyplosphaeria fusca TaxID=682080 RepID=A0A9P4VA08_9PLEO|nr:hypothetical protein EJ04DRAFT_481535 [Polyplosphaeria fusca]
MTWRPMPLDRVKDLVRVADKIHPDLPESAEVFAERVKLFPDGCLGLFTSDSDHLCGYIVSHPIQRRHPPALDALLGQIAPGVDQYYVHDLAILPEVRGKGYAQQGLEKVLAVAKGYATTGLVSVYGTAAFWGRFGFRKGEVDEGLRKKLEGYGEDAVYLERENTDTSADREQ